MSEQLSIYSTGRVCNHCGKDPGLKEGNEWL